MTHRKPYFRRWGVRRTNPDRVCRKPIKITINCSTAAMIAGLKSFGEELQKMQQAGLAMARSFIAQAAINGRCEVCGWATENRCEVRLRPRQLLVPTDRRLKRISQDSGDEKETCR